MGGQSSLATCTASIESQSGDVLSLQTSISGLSARSVYRAKALPSYLIYYYIDFLVDIQAFKLFLDLFPISVYIKSTLGGEM